MNSIFDEGSIIKQINKYKLKFISKLVITLSAQKSIIAKKNLLNSFINANDSQTKDTFNRYYKDSKNTLSTFFKPIQIILKILGKE